MDFWGRSEGCCGGLGGGLSKMALVCDDGGDAEDGEIWLALRVGIREALLVWSGMANWLRFRQTTGRGAED